MAKILILNLPYAGHIAPTLGLVKELVSNGHEVSYILSQEWKEKIEEQGAKFIEYKGYKGNPMVLRNCYDALYNTALMVGKDYDCIVYEMFFILGKRLAKRLQKPSVRLFSTFGLNKVVIQELIKQKGSMIWFFKYRGIRLFETKFQVRSLDREVKDFFEEIADCSQEKSIIYTSRFFQPYAKEFDKSKYYYVGTALEERKREMENEIPVIYISLGTLFNNNIKFYRKCIEAFQGEKVMVHMSVGTHICVKERIDWPENFKIYEYAPQIRLLQQADLFITHGGMNSVNEAIKLGVPMLVIPIAADQPYIAKRVSELQLGKCCSKKTLTPHKMKKLAFNIMDDPVISDSIRKASQDMEKYRGNKEAAEIIVSQCEAISHS